MGTCLDLCSTDIRLTLERRETKVGRVPDRRPMSASGGGSGPSYTSVPGGGSASSTPEGWWTKPVRPLGGVSSEFWVTSSSVNTKTEAEVEVCCSFGQFPVHYSPVWGWGRGVCVCV